MSLIIETGLVVANADSFLSLVDARTLSANYGLSISESDAEAEIQLRQGYNALLTYEKDLQGSRVSAIQTGIFPRYGVEKDCFAVASNAIPQDVKMAQLYQVDAISSGSVSNNTVDTGEKLSSFEVVGAYKESYQDDSSVNLNSTVQGVYNSLFPYTTFGACSNSGFGSGLGREEFGFVGR